MVTHHAQLGRLSAFLSVRPRHTRQAPRLESLLMLFLAGAVPVYSGGCGSSENEDESPPGDTSSPSGSSDPSPAPTQSVADALHNEDLVSLKIGCSEWNGSPCSAQSLGLELAIQPSSEMDVGTSARVPQDGITTCSSSDGSEGEEIFCQQGFAVYLAPQNWFHVRLTGVDLQPGSCQALAYADFSTQATSSGLGWEGVRSVLPVRIDRGLLIARCDGDSSSDPSTGGYSSCPATQAEEDCPSGSLSAECSSLSAYPSSTFYTGEDTLLGYCPYGYSSYGYSPYGYSPYGYSPYDYSAEGGDTTSEAHRCVVPAIGSAGSFWLTYAAFRIERPERITVVCQATTGQTLWGQVRFPLASAPSTTQGTTSLKPYYPYPDSDYDGSSANQSPSMLPQGSRLSDATTGKETLRLGSYRSAPHLEALTFVALPTTQNQVLDCAEGQGDRAPTRQEVCADALDNNCNAQTDESPCISGYASSTAALDLDGDGYASAVEWQEYPRSFYAEGAVTLPLGYTNLPDSDCDDADPERSPGKPELCEDGEDNDCDGHIDDLDGEGRPCRSIDNDHDGYTEDQGDCNDRDASIHPSMPEQCNGQDDNCDGQVDEGAALTWFWDEDGDGYGVSSSTTVSCSQPLGYVEQAGDCSPQNSAIHPGVEEACNGIDDNCSGQADEGYLDLDGDQQADCTDDDDDGDGQPDAVDLCPLLSDPDQLDTDADGLGDVCDEDDDNDGTADLEDCGPLDVTVGPDAVEVCDAEGIDEDCDGFTCAVWDVARFDDLTTGWN